MNRFEEVDKFDLTSLTNNDIQLLIEMSEKGGCEDYICGEDGCPLKHTNIEGCMDSCDHINRLLERYDEWTNKKESEIVELIEIVAGVDKIYDNDLCEVEWRGNNDYKHEADYSFVRIGIVGFVNGIYISNSKKCGMTIETANLMLKGLGFKIVEHVKKDSIVEFEISGKKYSIAEKKLIELGFVEVK